MNAGHRVRVFRTFLSRKEFPRFSPRLSSRCERFRKRRFSLPLHVNGEGGRSSFREETNFPFWCTRSRFLHAPRGEVFFSLFSFPLWKEKPIKGCWFFFPGEEVLNAVLEFCYQLFNYIDIIEQTSVSFYLSLSFSLFLSFLFVYRYCISLFLCFLLVYRFLYIYTDNILYSCCVLAN